VVSQRDGTVEVQFDQSPRTAGSIDTRYRSRSRDIEIVSISQYGKCRIRCYVSALAPLDIDTDGNYFDVTGTTNFAAMTVESGNFFMLQFDGALTITHGSGIEIPGAANLTTATGDRLICYATAANTVEVMSVETEAAAAGGAWNLISTVTASGASSADFTSSIDSTYDEYVIIGVGIVPGTDAQDLWCRLGNGGAFDTSGYDYVTSGKQSDGTGGVDDHNDSGDGVAQIVVSGDFGTGTEWGTATGETGNLVLHLHDPSSSLYTRMDMISSHDNATGVNCHHRTAGHRVESAAHDRIQFLFASGNINGVFRLYGIANS